MPARTLQQNSNLHKLLAETGLADEKEALAKQFSQGRTGRTSELQRDECAALIQHLESSLTRPTPEQEEAATKQRRKIISLAHEMRWQVPGTARADMAHINDWCKKYGFGHKPLNDYTLAELPKLVTQFRRVHKSFMDELNRA